MKTRIEKVADVLNLLQAARLACQKNASEAADEEEASYWSDARLCVEISISSASMTLDPLRVPATRERGV